MKKVHVAFGRSAFTNSIRQKELTINELYRKLKNPILRAKKDGEFFILASFKANKRSAENVKKYYGCVLDFDDTTLDIADIKKLFKKYSYCTYTTYQHKVKGKGERFRVVLPYKKPITAEENYAVTVALMQKIGAHNVDDSSKAKSRLYYLPACAEDRKKYFSSTRNLSDKFFNAQKLLREIDYDGENDLVNESVDDSDIDDGLSAAEKWEQNEYADNAIADFKQMDEKAVGNRNNFIYSFASSCFGKGYVYDKTLVLCKRKNEKFYKPLSIKDIITTINSIYSRHKKNNDLQDYGELLARIEKEKNLKFSFPIFVKMIVNSLEIIKESELQTLIKLLSDKTGLTVKSINASIKDEMAIYLDDEKQESEQTFKNNIHVFDNYVYITAIDKVIHLHKPISMKPEAFNKKMSKLTHGKKGVPADLTRFLIGMQLLKVAEIVSYRPDVRERFFKDEIGVNCVNSYIKPDLTPKVGSVKPMLKHFEHILRSSEERKIFLQYIAFMTQKVGAKIRWIIVLKGAKRIGKSFIAENFLEPIFGANNVTSIDAKSLTGRFNNWKGQTQLAICHELKLISENKNVSKADLTDNIKSFVTDKTLEVESKGQDTRQVKNVTNMIAFTNHEDVLYITADEERYMMLKSDLLTPLSRDYYIDLAAWAEKNTDKILNFFLNYDISDFDQFGAPATRYTNEIKNISANWPEWVVHHGLDDKHSLFNDAGVVTWTQVVDYIIFISEQNGMDSTMMQGLYNARSTSGYKLSLAIRESGFTYWQDPREVKERNFIYYKKSKLTLYRPPKSSKSQVPINKKQAKLIVSQNDGLLDFIEQ